MTQVPACSVCGIMTESKSTKTRSAWGEKVAKLSKEKGQEPFPQWAFIEFIYTGIQGI